MTLRASQGWPLRFAAGRSVPVAILSFDPAALLPACCPAFSPNRALIIRIACPQDVGSLVA